MLGLLSRPYRWVDEFEEGVTSRLWRFRCTITSPKNLTSYVNLIGDTQKGQPDKNKESGRVLSDPKRVIRSYTKKTWHVTSP